MGLIEGDKCYAVITTITPDRRRAIQLVEGKIVRSLWVGDIYYYVVVLHDWYNNKGLHFADGKSAYQIPEGRVFERSKKKHLTFNFLHNRAIHEFEDAVKRLKDNGNKPDDEIIKKIDPELESEDDYYEDDEGA